MAFAVTIAKSMSQRTMPAGLQGPAPSAINREAIRGRRLGERLMKNLLKIACAALFVVVSGTAYAADDLSPADKKAMHDYTLSMDKVKAMQAAMDDFNATAAKDPSLKAQTKSVGDSKSIADMEGRFQSNSRLMAIYSRHGISAHDAVVMPFVLMYAGMIVSYPTAGAKLSDETSPAQVAFFKAHQAELKKMSWLYGSNGD
jgi:hypothetical protein